MKKAIVTLAATVAFVASGLSQGFVYLNGGASNATKVSTNSVAGGAATGRTAGDGTFYFALFASTSQSTVNGTTTASSGASGTYVFNNLGGGTPSTGWELVGFGTNNATSSGAAGTFVGQTQGASTQGALNADGSMTVGNIAGGATGNFVIVGWSSNIGTDLASLEAWWANPTVAGYIGESRVGAGQTLGDNGSNPTLSVMGSTANYINGFTLGLVTPVPEPGTLALAALGGASLLLFRRKK